MDPIKKRRAEVAEAKHAVEARKGAAAAVELAMLSAEEQQLTTQFWRETGEGGTIR